MRLYFDRRPITTLADALALFKVTEFASATRSTVPLLSLLRDGNELWRQILAALEMPEQDTAAHLEYTVRSPRGRGKPSHTDAMLVAGEQACAIEAKWTEPPYPSVRRWLGPQPYSPNREAFLNGWLSLLQPHAIRELRLEDVLDVTYQTLHRAASACAAGDAPSLSYIAFTPGQDGIPTEVIHLRDGLQRLAAALGSPANFPLRLIEVEARPTSAFSRISSLRRGDLATGVAVRTALNGPPLFEFGAVHVHQVIPAPAHAHDPTVLF